MLILFFFLMIRRPPRSTLDRSSAASDVYKRQVQQDETVGLARMVQGVLQGHHAAEPVADEGRIGPVSYTHLRAHETVLDLVCRLLLEKKKKTAAPTSSGRHTDELYCTRITSTPIRPSVAHGRS